jgi:hypothetical protein
LGELRASVITVALAALWPVVLAAANQPAYLMDDFENPAALESWRVHGMPAPQSDALSLGAGHRGHGAVLTYQLPCDAQTECGAYAEATRTLPSSLPESAQAAGRGVKRRRNSAGLAAPGESVVREFPQRRDPAISLWIRFPPEVEVSVVAKDLNGQMLRFPIRATIEHFKAGGWQYVVVPLSAKPAADSGNGATGRIKGRLVEAGILVRARVRTAIQGSVSFDDMELRDSSESFHIDATAQPELPLPESFPPSVGVNIHLLRDDHALDLARAAGFSFVRMDMVWANVERAGRYRFRQYDALLSALEARGMGVLWILDYGHPDHGGSVPRTPQEIAAFGQFAEAAAAHFKGRDVRYEVWNEPNLSQFWGPAPNAREYAALLREAIAAIRRGDPSAKISSGGVSRMDLAFLSSALDPNLAAGLTAIAVHPYPKTVPESIAPDLEILRYWAAVTFGDRVEIWDTEWGYSSAGTFNDAPSNGLSDGARRRQAVLAVREMLTVWAVGFPLAVWYDLRDDGTGAENPEHNYGLLDSSGNEKPAMKSIRALTGAVAGRKYAGMIAETPFGIHAMRWDGSADTLLIVWTDQPGGRRTVEFTKRDLMSATGTTGEAVRWKDLPSGQARIEIEDAAGPIYLRWAKLR